MTTVLAEGALLEANMSRETARKRWIWWLP